jgi:PPOX class probable F420-dependent enzyme
VPGVNEQVRRFLAAPRFAVIATVGAGGAAHQAVLHYALRDDGTLMINGRADRSWLVNARRDPRVSVIVHDAERPLHYVMLRGRAELLYEGEPALEDAMELARRYGDDPESFRGQERVSLRVVPERIFEYTP